MKVLLAGATGAIGKPLSQALQSAGHHVLGLTRDEKSAATLTAAGVQPVVADALDRNALLLALRGVEADAVIHQLTALKEPPARHSGMEATNRLRTTGTENLLAAATQLGATRFVTQSIVLGYGYIDHGSRVLTEDDDYGRPNSGKANPHIAAMLANEQLVRGSKHLDGIALRYGMFYGADVETYKELLHKRKVPVPSSTKLKRDLAWIHIDDAAAATVAALEHGQPGSAYNIVDDDPTSWGRMFNDMADTVGAPRPRKLPSWMIRAAAPYVAAMVLNTSMHVSNVKAKAELGWKPVYPSHTEGLKTLASR